MLTAEQIRDYDRDGYVLVPDVFTPAEVAILKAHAGRERRGDFLVAFSLGEKLDDFSFARRRFVAVIRDRVRHVFFLKAFKKNLGNLGAEIMFSGEHAFDRCEQVAAGVRF